MPDLDPSHDWHGFDESEPSENRMCHRCEVCSCHSPEASRERCEFAVSQPTESFADRLARQSIEAAEAQKYEPTDQDHTNGSPAHAGTTQGDKK
jgi:hypothetical protein